MSLRGNNPASTLTPLSKKTYEEVLTAHNISSLLLLRAYLPEKGFESYNVQKRVGFCRLILFLLHVRKPSYKGCLIATKKAAPNSSNLLQSILEQNRSPDFSFSEFISFISDPKYKLGSVILNRFQSNVLQVVNSEVDLLFTFISDTNNYLFDPQNGPMDGTIGIHRCSPIGVFIRRMTIYLSKLTFSQSVKVYRLYQQYCLAGEDSLKYVNPERSPLLPSILEEETSNQLVDSDKASCSRMNITEINEHSCNMEISVITQNPFTNPIVALFGVDSTPASDEKFMECLSWSHRQTELFLVEQATFLEFDENSALSPPELHRILNRIILINPDYPETYFVSYMNCLRVKEFNGALENLFKFFDSVNFTDKTKSYRYAALNLAMFNVKFNNRAGAIATLRECIMLSHESNDNVCLHFAQAWLRRLNEDEKLELIESTVLKCDELELHQIASLSLQMCAQKFLIMGLDNSLIFNLLDKGDAINAQHTLPDLTLTNLAHRASIWCAYGQFNITFFMSQILLNIDTSYAVYGLKTYNTEDGKYQVSKMVLSHAKDRFPHEFSEWWKMCELILYFEYSLRHCFWNDAYKAASRIAAIDKEESMLRLAELSYEKGDKVEAAARIDDLLAIIEKRKSQKNQFDLLYLLRAFLIAAKVKSGGASFFMLLKALNYAIRYGYPRFRALILLELARLQLELGFVRQATQLVGNASGVIFSENRYDEQAAALTLLAKCDVAAVRNLDETCPQRTEQIKQAIANLQVSKTLYQKLECVSKIKDVVYLQAVLANEIGSFEARNAYAFEFRKIDVENDHSYSCTSDFYTSL